MYQFILLILFNSNFAVLSLYLTSNRNVAPCRPRSHVLYQANFNDYTSMPTWLRERCSDLGFKEPNLVQQASLPLVFDGKDIVLQSQTGSGKTLVYVLPILAGIDPTRASIQAVVIVPTRELGLQVCSVFKQLAQASPSKIMIMPLVEGSKNRRQQLWAVAEPPHIIVGNPKSLQRLVQNGRLRLNCVSYVVLDEVDACLSNTEIKQDLHKLLSRRLSNTYREVDDTGESSSLPESLVYRDLAKNHRDLESRPQFNKHRQTIMCSATIPQRQHFASLCLKNGWTLTLPELIHVSAKELVPESITHEYVECPKEQRFACLRYLIKKELDIASKPTSSDSPDTTVMKSRLDSPLTKFLKRNAENVSVPSPSTSLASKNPFQAIVFIADDDVSSGTSTSTVSLRLSRYANEFDGSTHSNGGKDSSLIYSVMDSIDQLFDYRRTDFNLSYVSLLTEHMTLDQRAASLNAFRSGECTVLLCTSCGARGIDIPSITHVIQLDLPKSVDHYVHQVGRAGRVGRAGKAITIIAPGSDFAIDRYSNEIGVPIRKRTLKVKSKEK